MVRRRGGLNGYGRFSSRQVEDLQAAPAEAVAPPAEDDGVEAVGQHSGDEGFALSAVKEPADEIREHLGRGMLGSLADKTRPWL